MAKESTESVTTNEPKHRASYARDKKQGGYLIRIAGPYPEKFAGRDIPVTRMDGTKTMEKVTRLIWTGTDTETGQRVALYKFEPRPRETEEEVEF